MEEILKLERVKLPMATTSEAENFFLDVSNATGAHVQWETGCKTLPHRKEPCIKICGSEENIQRAKDMLINKMEITSNRVVMKIDVAHFEHPSLIGKGGKLIKKVMDTTGCHIHFPDSNKCSVIEKSNQVSIYGDPASVERARVMLRALIPVQMDFEVPTTSCFQPILESLSPDCQLLASSQGLFIYSAHLPSGIKIIVRCNQDQFPNLRKEIIMLMEFLCCKNGANLPPVQMTTNIIHHHHIYIKGNNNSNVEGIMKRTGARIIFPDINSARLDKNSVRIVGSLDCVYMAWQEILNHLPVSVSFDINGTRSVNGEYRDFLQDCGIKVYSCPKPKYYIQNVIVKGCEKFSKQMLQYRQHLLGLPSLNFTPDIDDINLSSRFLSELTQYFQSSLSNVIPSSVTNVVSKSTNFGVIQHIMNGVNCPTWLETALHEQFSSMRNNSVSPERNYQILTKPDLYSDTKRLIRELDYYMQANSLKICSSQLQNEVQLLLARHSVPNDNEVTAGQPSFSSPDQTNETQEPHDLLMEENKYDASFSEIDYYRKKAQAAKAMRRPIESMESTQVPSSLWAGYGFSQSMPASVIKDNSDLSNQFSYFHFNNDGSNSSSQDSESWENIVLKDCLDGNIWSNKKESTFSHSNYFDFLRNMPLPFDCTTKDILPELLWQHGLHKYIDLFTKEEITYQTFLLLNDEDLQSLGISYQARMKLICLIRELQDKNSKTFNAAPGAGRKR